MFIFKGKGFAFTGFRWKCQINWGLSSDWISHQGGLSLIRMGFLHQTRLVLHQAGFSPVWSCIRLGFHQGDLASGWVFTKVVLHQDGFFHQGGLASGWLFTQVVTHWSALSEWVFIGVVCYQGGFHLGGFLSGCSLISLIRVGFLHHSSSSFMSVMRVAFHQGVIIGQNQLSL